MTYTVNLHHIAGFIRTHKVVAASRTDASAIVEAMYPAKVITKIVVL